jgi:hypothetical protein
MADLIKAGEKFNSLECVSIASKALRGMNQHPIQVRPYERCLWVRIDDNEVILCFETFKYRESRYRVTFTKKGLRTVTYSRATGKVTDKMETWFEGEPEVTAVATFARDEKEQRERAEHEAMAHRVGSSKAPLDSYARTVQYKSTDKMERFWR